MNEKMIYECATCGNVSFRKDFECECGGTQRREALPCTQYSVLKSGAEMIKLIARAGIDNRHGDVISSCAYFAQSGAAENQAISAMNHDIENAGYVIVNEWNFVK